jgi:hypothetical protein
VFYERNIAHSGIPKSDENVLVIIFGGV